MVFDFSFAFFRTELVIALCVLIIAYLVKIYGTRRKDYPPGPHGLPVVGYLPFLTKMPPEKLVRLGRKYGDVISLQLGSQAVVVLNSGDVIREAFAKQEFLGRPDQSRFFIVPINSPFFGNGKVWQEHRRFTFRVFKELDSGRAMEKHIKGEIESFMKVIEEQNGKPCDLSFYLSSSVANNITAFSFGERYDFKHPEREILDNILDEAAKKIGFTSLVVFFPWLKNISMMRKLLDMDNYLKLYEEFDEYTKKKIEQHKKVFETNQPKDFIDFYFSELSAKRQKEEETTFSEKYLPDSVQLLYGAGSETTRTTISWCLYTMAAFPQVQEKVQKEIDEVVGRERSPSFADHKEMCYTQSVLMEIQRWKTVVPLSVLRMTLADTDVAGYRIPKGTFILANLWAVHHDPRCWKNPEDFVPDRFLSEDGQSVMKNENYMPFSVGKRSCLGEKIAVIEVFLYFTRILQKFRVQLPEGQKPNFDGSFGITYQLKPHELRFTLRED